MGRTTMRLLAIAAIMFTFQVSAEERPAPDAGPRGPEVMLHRMDTNHDGKITADEVPDGAPDFVKEMLKRADKDGDKAVTAAELQQAVPPSRGGPPHRPEAGPGGRRPDGPPPPDHGGRGAPEGRPQPPGPRPDMAAPKRPDPKAIFARLDKDGDQKLSVDEFAEGMKMFHSQNMAARGPMMGRGPMGFYPGLGPTPMAGRGPRMGGGPMGPRPGMGRPPMAWRGAIGPRCGHGPMAGGMSRMG
ncbi:MAG: hypothetical protein HUU20_27560, partial [Pirellulales bacterium]|nr:hypothetical protein [Pirellulales bacterium]